MKKSIKILISIVVIIAVAVFCYFFVGWAPKQEKIIWGISFSQKHAQNLGLDWQQTYLALLDDLKIKHLRLISHWDLIEKEQDQYNFRDLDWQIDEAEKRGVGIILVIGMKTPRWPECHIPDWAELFSQEKMEKENLHLIKEITSRYRRRTSIIGWQVENEPFFNFGECPEIREDFVIAEIALVKSLDSQNRKVIITESGTGSFWFKGAELGDEVGISLYRKACFHQPRIYITYPSPAIFYWRKAQIIKRFFNKEIICTELQAEPWGPKLLYESSLEEQEKTMNLEIFKRNIDFAEKTGLKEFYLWGGEWWYWLKTKQNNDEIWQEVKNLII